MPMKEMKKSLRLILDNEGFYNCFSDNAIQDFLLAQPLWHISPYTIISKYGKRMRMAVGENYFALELNEKKVIELLENAKPGSRKKATNYGMKIFQGKNNLSIRVSQSKTMQVEKFTYLKIICIL